MANTITTAQKSWFADSVAIPAAEAVPDALALNGSIATQCAAPKGDATLIRVPYIDADPEAATVKEGADIAQGDPTLSELTFPTVKVGLLHKVSNEAMNSTVEANSTSGQLTDSLRRAITNKLDALLLTNPATGTDYTGVGLMNHSAVADAGQITPDTGLTPLLDAIAQVGDNGATPTGIVMSNTAWAKTLKLTAADGRPLVNPDVQTTATPMLYGLPVITNRMMPADSLIVIDATNLFTAVTELNVDVNDAMFFGSDSTAIRVTARIGWGIARAGRLARLTITDQTGTTKTK